MPQKPPFRWPKRGVSQAQAGLREGFRSGLEERNVSHVEQMTGKRPAFEAIKVPYTIPASGHTYLVDIRLANGILVETKGRFMPDDRKKHLLVKQQHPDLDLRFVFTRAKAPINPGSKTTCAMWAEKNGFQWAEKLIPVEWMKEPPGKRTPEEILSGRAP